MCVLHGRITKYYKPYSFSSKHDKGIFLRRRHTHAQLIIQILCAAKTDAVREKGKTLHWIFLGREDVKNILDRERHYE